MLAAPVHDIPQNPTHMGEAAGGSATVRCRRQAHCNRSRCIRDEKSDSASRAGGALARSSMRRTLPTGKDGWTAPVRGSGVRARRPGSERWVAHDLSPSRYCDRVHIFVSEAGLALGATGRPLHQWSSFATSVDASTYRRQAADARRSYAYWRPELTRSARHKSHLQ